MQQYFPVGLGTQDGATDGEAEKVDQGDNVFTYFVHE